MRYKVQQVLGISGGKDSASLAIYMSENYPNLDLIYYTCDTGKELKETYDLIDKLNGILNKKVELFKSQKIENSEVPFDYFLDKYKGFLPSSRARWCTRELKLNPFEHKVKNKPTISYVGIRGDEDREGYISKSKNIQSIFPFRKNIWCYTVTTAFLANDNIDFLSKFYEGYSIIDKVKEPVSMHNSILHKAEVLLDYDIKLYNRCVFEFLKTTDYPVGKLDSFPLIDNVDVITIDDVFGILKDSGVGVPKYYLPIEFEVEIDGKIEKGTYSRSRSGCYFCFFQQKIEWVWLLETHPELYDRAQSYEKDSFSWSHGEFLSDLRKPDRVRDIKIKHIKKLKRDRLRKEETKQMDWVNQIKEAEGTGCASCFI